MPALADDTDALIAAARGRNTAPPDDTDALISAAQGKSPSLRDDTDALVTAYRASTAAAGTAGGYSAGADGPPTAQRSGLGFSGGIAVNAASAAADALQGTQPNIQGVAKPLGRHFRAEVGGANTFNPFSWEASGPTGQGAGALAPLVRLGNSAIGLVSPNQAQAHAAPREQYLQAAQDGNAPFLSLSSDPRQKARQLTEIKKLQPLLDRYNNQVTGPIYAQIGALPDKVNAPGQPFLQPNSPEWLARYNAQRQDLAQQYADAWDPKKLADYLQAQGVKLTPMQQQALGPLAAAERFKFANDKNVVSGMAKDVLLHLAAHGAGALAEHAAAPLVTQAGEALSKAFPGAADAAATPLGQFAGRVFNPAKIAGRYAGGAAFQGADDLTDPNLTLDQRLARINQGGVAGAFLGTLTDAAVEGAPHLKAAAGKAIDRGVRDAIPGSGVLSGAPKASGVSVGDVLAQQDTAARRAAQSAPAPEGFTPVTHPSDLQAGDVTRLRGFPEMGYLRVKEVRGGKALLESVRDGKPVTARVDALDVQRAPEGYQFQDAKARVISPNSLDVKQGASETTPNFTPVKQAPTPVVEQPKVSAPEVIRPTEPPPAVNAAPVEQVAPEAPKLTQPEAAPINTEATPKSTEAATGLANQVQERELHAIAPPEKGVTRSAVEAQEAGRRAVVDGQSDPESLAAEIAKGQRPFSWQEAGVLLEGKRRLLNSVNTARDALDQAVAAKAPNVGELRSQYGQLRERLQTFVDNVQKGKTEWHNTGQSLQAGTTLDEGNFADVIQEARRQSGRPLSEIVEREYRQLAGQIKAHGETIAKMEAALKRAQAEATVEPVQRAARGPRLNREAIRQERAAIHAEIDQILKEATSHVGSGTQVAYDAARLGGAAGKLAVNYLKEGAATLEEMAARVIADFHARGVTISHDQVIDALNAEAKGNGGRRTRSEMEERIATLKAQARRDAAYRADIARLESGHPLARAKGQPASTTPRLDDLRARRNALVKAQRWGAELERVKSQITALEQGQPLPQARSTTAAPPEVEAARAKRGEMDRTLKTAAEIKSLEQQLKSGVYVENAPKVRAISKQLEDLKARKEILAREVRKRIDAEKPKTGADRAIAGVENGLNFVRGTILGSDVGVLTRQGLFAWSHPGIAAKAVGRGVQSALSEEAMVRWELETRDRRINGQDAFVERKRAGLQMTDGTTNAHEEIIAARLLKKIPGIGKYTGGLERFQQTFINSVRADLFDEGLKAGWTPAELKLRAEFINSATGRGNVQKVPTWMRVLFTSPRYERSRWEMMARPFKDVGVLGADLATGKGINRAALTNVRDMAVTTAGVIALFKVAELAGYRVDWNPTSSDFLKMRRGNDVWDVSAGLAPRLRDIARIYVATTHPSYQQNVGKVLLGAGLRTINPAVRTPFEQASMLSQRAQGNSQPRLPLEGFRAEDDRQGLITLTPLIVQSIKQALDQEGPGGAVSAGAREFVGSSVNRYPKPKPR